MLFLFAVKAMSWLSDGQLWIIARNGEDAEVEACWPTVRSDRGRVATPVDFVL